MNETLWHFILHGNFRTWFVLIGIIISIMCFMISVLKDKKDDHEHVDQDTILHSKTFKIGILSIIIGIFICIGIDFSGGCELTLTGFAFIFLRQSIQGLRNHKCVDKNSLKE